MLYFFTKLQIKEYLAKKYTFLNILYFQYNRHYNDKKNIGTAFFINFLDD